MKNRKTPDTFSQLLNQLAEDIWLPAFSQLQRGEGAPPLLSMKNAANERIGLWLAQHPQTFHSMCQSTTRDNRIVGEEHLSGLLLRASIVRAANQYAEATGLNVEIIKQNFHRAMEAQDANYSTAATHEFNVLMETLANKGNGLNR
jgi:hypothetical protein